MSKQQPLQETDAEQEKDAQTVMSVVFLRKRVGTVSLSIKQGIPGIGIRPIETLPYGTLENCVYIIQHAVAAEFPKAIVQ